MTPARAIVDLDRTLAELERWWRRWASGCALVRDLMDRGHDLDDLHQEVLIEVWRRHQRHPPDLRRGRLSPWVRSTVVQRLLQLRRVTPQPRASSHRDVALVEVRLSVSTVGGRAVEVCAGDYDEAVDPQPVSAMHSRPGELDVDASGALWARPVGWRSSPPRPRPAARRGGTSARQGAVGGCDLVGTPPEPLSSPRSRASGAQKPKIGAGERG